MPRKGYHVSVPTPLEPNLLLLTVVLFILHFTNDVSWWVVAGPTLVSLGLILVALIGFRIMVAVLNRRNEFRQSHMFARFGGPRR